MRQIKLSFLSSYCKTERAREAHERLGRGGLPASPHSPLRAAVEGRDESWAQQQLPEHQAEVSSSLQLRQGANHSQTPPQMRGWLLLGRVALLLRLEECKPPELLLRIGQEKSTNSNRKSKCPLQTCT